MFKLLKSEDGVTFLDVMIGIVALLGFTSMMVTTTNFISKNQRDIREFTEYNQIVHNTVIETYEISDWEDIEDDEILTKDGSVHVSYNYGGVSEDYLTRRLDIVFRLNEKEDVYQLERGVFDE